MAVSHLQRRIYGPNTDIVFQSHGPETDLRNAGAMGFNDLHYYLPGTALFWMVGGGPRKNALSLRRCQPGFRAIDMTRGGAAKNLTNVRARCERDNTFGSKVLSIDLTLE